MSQNYSDYDVIIIGAGAAGLMCAAKAGQKGLKVWLIDHAKKIGEKIRISGGGRCNFTNMHTSPAHFLSQNPHFCKSALSGYRPDDFVALVEQYQIGWHEKKLGQLFCDESAQQIIDMLLAECAEGGVTPSMETEVDLVLCEDGVYQVSTNRGNGQAPKLVIATGGLSIPKIGASSFGYKMAQQFGHEIIPTRAALVPLTFSDGMLDQCRAISGVSVEAQVSYDKTSFAEGLLFTHRGLSGPSVLQISSYWSEGQSLEIDLASGHDVKEFLLQQKQANPKREVQTLLAELLPKRLVEQICADLSLAGKIAELSNQRIQALAERVNAWQVKPNGSEGYRTAEVTLGGVDTAQVSSKTMESKIQPGLYFIGEVLDVTGHLGGFNFQWAWASAVCAARAL